MQLRAGWIQEQFQKHVFNRVAQSMPADVPAEIRNYLLADPAERQRLNDERTRARYRQEYGCEIRYEQQPNGICNIVMIDGGSGKAADNHKRKLKLLKAKTKLLTN